ncbi:MAG: PALP domain-containing protein, partial [Planctomycetota bacterium]
MISVPCGNFGDLVAGLLAFKCGLPVKRFIVATNANDEVPRFFVTGKYEKIVPSRTCISNAMNVGHPSNLARLVDLYGGWMDETGKILEMPDMEAIRRDMFAVSIDDKETRETIEGVYRRHGAMLEPHGAVGWAGLMRFLEDHPDESGTPAVSFETAHPAKFPEEIEA